MIKSITPGRSLTLVRNPSWQANTDPGRHQYVDSFHFEADRSAAEIDATMRADTGAGQTSISMDSISSPAYQRLDAVARQRLVRGHGSCTFLRYPDYRSVTDIAVRRALAYAFPYRGTWRAMGQIPGVTILPATNLLPPGVVGRVPYNPLPGHVPGETDAAKARSLLAASGHLGYRIRFAYPADDPSAVHQKHSIVQALSAAGFSVTAVPTTLANYADDFLRNPDAAVNLRSVGWCSDWPTGSSFIPQQFGSTDLATEGFGTNFAAFSEPTVDARIAGIQRLPLAQQPAAWNALDRLIQTRYFPVVATGYSGVAMMRGSRVHHDFVDSVYMMPTWKDIWLR
jgi:peptide/nickel transport system substrate-binding protein